MRLQCSFSPCSILPILLLHNQNPDFVAAFEEKQKYFPLTAVTSEMKNSKMKITMLSMLSLCLIANINASSNGDDYLVFDKAERAVGYKPVGGGLTGDQLNGAEMLPLGIGTHFIPSQDKDANPHVWEDVIPLQRLLIPSYSYHFIVNLVDEPKQYHSCMFLRKLLESVLLMNRAHKRPKEQNLFGIVQGGLDPILRDTCVRGLKVPIFLIQQNRHALIGRATDDHDMKRVLEFLKNDRVVDSVYGCNSEVIRPRFFRFKAEIEDDAESESDDDITVTLHMCTAGLLYQKLLSDGGNVVVISMPEVFNNASSALSPVFTDPDVLDCPICLRPLCGPVNAGEKGIDHNM
ncbi:metal tolerance protein C4 [Tanacetum coccineum]